MDVEYYNCCEKGSSEEKAETETSRSQGKTVSDKNKLPHEKLPKEALGLLKLLLEEVDCREDWMHGVIHVAVEHENIEFLSLIISDYPEFMSCKRGDTITSGLVFSTILKRQKDISKVLKDIRPSFKKQILNYKDDQGNNILHLAGKLSPSEQLDATCGVALQLQQELMWFETSKQSLSEYDDDDEGKSWSLIKKWKDSACWRS
ncbi:hypothetical protein Patl1_12373 [Pistacia atlantica]|uniref:Uncharacterized protein n=1 Tax=Pistacia atlantica TaxID=434234 RepID=A0ACC1A4K5_9ROSI|nr:hypothetical protein Patl1_12373 [Pistacia atlantica]